MEKIKILPQTIFKYQCDPELISNTLEMIKDEEWKSSDQVEYIGQTYNCLLNRQSKYQKLHEWIHECLHEIKQELEFNCDCIKIVQSWANRGELGQWMWRHLHPNSFISGILYLTDSNAQTFFYYNNIWNNNYSVSLWPQKDERYEICHKQSTVAGDLIIFPSQLYHSVDEHMSEGDDRYTLSFNSFPSGKIGSFGGKVGMEIDIK